LRSPLPGPEEVALNRVRREVILEALAHLLPREAEVLRLRYGLDGTPLSLGEIAQRFKISRGGCANWRRGPYLGCNRTATFGSA